MAAPISLPAAWPRSVDLLSRSSVHARAERLSRRACPHAHLRRDRLRRYILIRRARNDGGQGEIWSSAFSCRFRRSRSGYWTPLALRVDSTSSSPPPVEVSNSPTLTLLMVGHSISPKIPIGCGVCRRVCVANVPRARITLGRVRDAVVAAPLPDQARRARRRDYLPSLLLPT